MKRGHTATNIFQAQGNNKIGYYQKYLLIFTAYQVQVWWNMIISTVNAQPYGINVRTILLER